MTNANTVLSEDFQLKASIGRPLTMDDAFDAAGILAGIPGVMQVELFGSFARGENRSDSDLDFILCTDDKTSERFYDDLDWVTDAYAGTTSRYEIAIRLLDVGLLRQCLLKIYRGRLDIFIFPMNWRDQLQNLQWLGHHRDENFMANIARDALPFRRSFERRFDK